MDGPDKLAAFVGWTFALFCAALCVLIVVALIRLCF